MIIVNVLLKICVQWISRTMWAKITVGANPILIVLYRLAILHTVQLRCELLCYSLFAFEIQLLNGSKYTKERKA